MKRLLLSTLLVIPLTAAILQLTSCDCEWDTLRLTDVQDLIVYDLDKLERSDTISGPFVLQAFGEFDIVMGAMSLMHPSLYAISCSDDYQTSFIDATISLTLGTTIDHDGQQLSAGTDISTLKTIEVQLAHDSINLTFSKTFLSKAMLDKGNHTFSMLIQTTDGQTYMSRGTFYFDP